MRFPEHPTDKAALDEQVERGWERDARAMTTPEDVEAMAQCLEAWAEVSQARGQDEHGKDQTGAAALLRQLQQERDDALATQFIAARRGGKTAALHMIKAQATAAAYERAADELDAQAEDPSRHTYAAGALHHASRNLRALAAQARSQEAAE